MQRNRQRKGKEELLKRKINPMRDKMKQEASEGISRGGREGGTKAGGREGEDKKGREKQITWGEVLENMRAGEIEREKK